ncbi:cytochrome b/b6 domain-containing protein [Ferrimonas senticii]|uniref:cytochrome b/b6 domain-containing protein n=1 Tax=Ferrimonas senticii TaxID=394566 RepID=UPI0003FFE376|nr:cytochrome b/b6 domain-containing protein [Ferrimonas senticii]
MSIRVWDPLVRICHWGIALLLPLCWYSADQGEMELHQSAAYLLAALLFARLSWGLFGSVPARFSHFVRSPQVVLDYLRQWRAPRSPHLGHNPAGGYMVLLLWMLLLCQFATGLFITDDILTEGPLYGSVSASLASWFSQYHGFGINLLLGAVALHLTAIAVYRLRGISLVTPMLHGKVVINTAQPLLRPWPVALGWLIAWVIVVALWLIAPLW